MLTVVSANGNQISLTEAYQSRGDRVLDQAIDVMRRQGSADHILRDFLEEDRDQAASILDFFLDDPNEIYFTFSCCLQGVFGRHDPAEVNRAINLLLRLGVIMVHGDLRQDRDTIVFVMNPRYDTWYASV